MNKKKIKQTDWKKILTKMAVSLGLLMVVILVLINTITQYPDVAVPLAITLLFLLSGYWIYLGLSKKNKLYLSFDEFKKSILITPTHFLLIFLKKMIIVMRKYVNY